MVSVVSAALSRYTSSSDPNVIRPSAMPPEPTRISPGVEMEVLATKVVNVPAAGVMPFTRNNVILDKGCMSPFSLVKSNSAFYMVGAGADKTPAIWQFSGNGYTKKSTEAIEQLLSTYTENEIGSIFAMSYSENGSYFITFTLPDRTICFDIITERWSERTSLIEEEEKPWRVSSIMTAYGMVIVGDTIDGKIGEMSLDFVEEYGGNIIRLFTTMPFANAGDEIVVKMLELTLESGKGTADNPDPVVSFASSRDGKTFSHERIRKIGKIGEYNRRVVWYRNGLFDRFVVFQFRLSGPIKSAFIKLEFE